MTNALLVKYGEIALRGGNRKLFEDRLITAIKDRLVSFGEFRVMKEQGRILIESGSGDIKPITGAVADIFGLVGVCPCIKTDNQDIDNLKELALAYMRERYGDGAAYSFKVETSRAVKSYPMLSNEVSAEVGRFLAENMPALTVDVNRPQIKLKIELRSAAYIYSDIIKGLGGLPAGSGGKGVLLLSGGFDSPVAGYLAAKRGVDLTCVYFHSPPYTSERAKEKVVDLASRLSWFAGGVTLYTVPFTDTQTFLRDSVPEVKLTIFLKRAMLRAAGIIAEKTGARALITGDSIGQVASQTLHALEAVESAADLPVLRPLCGMDKLEIMDLASKIGTYDISARPYPDCCTLFVAKHPETKPKRSVIENMEKRLSGLDELIRLAADGAELIRL